MPERGHHKLCPSSRMKETGSYQHGMFEDDVQISLSWKPNNQFQTSTFTLTSKKGVHALLVVSERRYQTIFFFWQILVILSMQSLRNAFNLKTVTHLSLSCHVFTLFPVYFLCILLIFACQKILSERTSNQLRKTAGESAGIWQISFRFMFRYLQRSFSLKWTIITYGEGQQATEWIWNVSGV